MTDQTTYPLLWLDLETTGLSFDDDRIIEVAACLTEPEWPFKRIDDSPFVSLVDPSSGGSFSARDVVISMHAVNGLWRELAENNPPSLEAVERNLVAWIGRNVAGSKVTLTGDGVGHFDHRMLERWMPKVWKRLTYYSLDFGVVRRWQKAIGNPLLVEDTIHRAWPDVTDALEAAHALGAPKPPQTFVCSVCFAPINGDVMQVTGSRTSHYPACPGMSDFPTSGSMP